MVFSDTVNKNGIIQMCEDLCKLGDGGITNDSTLFLKATAGINQADKKVGMAILRADKRWKFDDSNYINFPIAAIDLDITKRDYTLPSAVSGGNASTLWRVNKIQVKDTSGNLHTVELMDSDEEELSTSGFPTKYNLIGNSIRFKEFPSGVTTTEGLVITFQRSIVEFTTASTTQQPGFIDTYHDLLAYDYSSVYLMPLNTQLAISYSNIYENRLKLLQADYALRNDDVKRRLTPMSQDNH